MAETRDYPRDFSAGLSVFLVAVPLCVGIAYASGAPLTSGLLSGIIGGIVVGALSGSHTSVSGPAAGLTTIVLAGIAELGSFPAFLTAVVLAGALQIVLGRYRAGTINRFFPSPVIKGMLTAIGLILVTKQLPHLVGYDSEAFGVEGFAGTTQVNTLTHISKALGEIQPGALLIGLLSLAVLYLWGRFARKHFPLVPGPLLAAVVGVSVNAVYTASAPQLAVTGHHLVTLPDFSQGIFVFPDFRALGDIRVYLVAVTLALVSSIETLLTIEGVDRLDPEGHYTPPNPELVAQGWGNVVAGCLGGLPLTAVLGRSSVNIEAGGEHKTATIAHGFYLLLSLLFLRPVMNLVPLATLAAILVYVGARLALAANVKELWSKGPSQVVPYVTTTVAVLFTDLLLGIGVGLIVAAAFILRNLHLGRGLQVERHGRVTKVIFNEEVTFFHKVSLARILEHLPDGSIVEIDGSRSRSVDYDVIDTLQQFRKHSVDRKIEMIVGGIELLESYTPEQMSAIEAEYARLLSNNREWVDSIVKEDPTYFERQATGQTPSFLFIGCSDSRVPAETITKTDPGRLFVHRNIANLVSHHDVNLMSVLQYSVEVLNVPHIIVCGHYGCGGCRAAISNRSLGLIDNWIHPIKVTVKNHHEELKQITDPLLRERRVIELHVMQQVRNLLKTSVVQRSISKLGTPQVHGWVYDLETGLIKDLKANVSLKDDINPVFQFNYEAPAGH